MTICDKPLTPKRMYKATIKDLHEAYLKGYVDGLQGREPLTDGKAVVSYLMGSLSDINKTGAYGVETSEAYQSWQTEIINKEIEDFYNENMDTEERIITPRDPFGEHFNINESSAKEK